MKDFPYERYLRDARILLIFEVILDNGKTNAKIGFYIEYK